MPLSPYLKYATLFFTLCLLGSSSVATQAKESKRAFIINIIDGKTVQTKKIKIKLAGIKETTPQAKPYLERVLLNQEVMLDFDSGTSKKKPRAYVIIQNENICINEQLVRNGFASYKQGSNLEYNALLKTAQKMARLAEIGIWAKGAAAPGQQYKQGTAARAPPKQDIVYITKTGKKYHRAGCRYLSRSKIPIERKEAQKYYSPCKVCKP